MATLVSAYTVRNSADLNTDATRYFNFCLQGIGTLATAAANETAALPCAVIGGRIVVDLDVAPGAGNSRTFEIWNQTLDASISVTISDTATTGDSGDQVVTWSAGDLIVGRMSGAGTADTATNWWPYVELHATDRYIWFGGTGNFGGITSTESYTPAWGVIVDAATSTRTKTTAAADGTLMEVSAYCSPAPGTGETLTVDLQKNGSGAGITDPDITGTNQQTVVSGLSLDIAPGDYFEWRVVESATAVTYANMAFAYAPDVSGTGTLWWSGTIDSTPVTTEHQTGVGNGWSTWANRGAPLYRAYTITHHRVVSDAAPGTSNTVTLSLAIDDDGGGNATTTLTGAAQTSDTWSGTLAITSGNYIAERYDVTGGTPAAMQLRWAYAATGMQLAAASNTRRYTLTTLGVG